MATKYVLEDRTTSNLVAIQINAGASQMITEEVGPAQPEPIVKDEIDNTRWRIFIDDEQLLVEDVEGSTADDDIQLVDVSTGALWRLVVENGQLQVESVQLFSITSEFKSKITPKHYVGEIGTGLIFDTEIELNADESTILKLKVTKPDGTVETWDAVFLNTTKLKHVLEAGDFDQPGVYKFHAYLESFGSVWYGALSERYVYNPFEDETITSPLATSPLNINYRIKKVTASGGTTTIALDNDDAFKANTLYVFRNGILIEKDVDYTEAEDQKSITLTTALAADDVLEVRYVKN